MRLSNRTLRPYRWVSKKRLGGPTFLSVHNGSPTQVLSKVRGGAVLYWSFDADQDGECSLVCFLTDKEALAVVQRDTDTEGMLEPIRPQMHTTSALVLALRPNDDYQVVPLEISRHATEDEFVGSLFAAAEQACENFGRDMEPAPVRLHVSEVDLRSAFTGRGVSPVHAA